ncbi:acetylcholinesterase-like [Lineus longissimus]|uniref:acetylcholinesterase-like n=1 Tax=Lineus longissimus TaxID=88925 RepID=UPI00315DE35D
MEALLIVILGCLHVISPHVTQGEIQYSVLTASINNDVIVRTKSGTVRGFKQEVSGRTVETYLGIPYAKPPVGKQRFRRPEPYGRWSGIKNTTVLPPSCYQSTDENFDRFPGVEMWNPNTKLSEDCLYLNIWYPRPKEDSKRAQTDSKLPVLVWIYGGGFYSGSSTLDIYDARILAAHTDVIVASMQYRLGPLGFYFLDHELAPGNVGLLDQSMALEWIKANIEHFGGDKDRITIFGESAGAVSVGFQLISPMSRDLFTNAIMQSGSALCPWAVQSHSLATRRCRTLARLVGCDIPGNDTRQIMECLYQVDPLKLTNQQWHDDIIDAYFEVPIGPVVDKYFFPEHPNLMLQKGQYKRAPILLGSNKDEGSWFLLYGLLNTYFNLKNERELERNEFLGALKAITGNNHNLVMDAIVFQYERSQPQHVRGTYRDVLDDIAGDHNFICPTNDFAAIYTHGAQDVFMYRFLHRSTVNPWPAWMGVMHGYEIEFIFGKPLNKSLKYTKEERILSRRMMKMWSNFAKTGNPNKANKHHNKTEKWPRYKLDNKVYLNLDGQRKLRVEVGPRTKACAFWSRYIPSLLENIRLRNTVDRGPKCAQSQQSRGRVTGSSGRHLRMSCWIVLVFSLLTLMTSRYVVGW